MARGSRQRARQERAHPRARCKFRDAGCIRREWRRYLVKRGFGDTDAVESVRTRGVDNTCGPASSRPGGSNGQTGGTYLLGPAEAGSQMPCVGHLPLGRCAPCCRCRAAARLPAPCSRRRCRRYCSCQPLHLVLQRTSLLEVRAHLRQRHGRPLVGTRRRLLSESVRARRMPSCLAVPTLDVPVVPLVRSACPRFRVPEALVPDPLADGRWPDVPLVPGCSGPGARCAMASHVRRRLGTAAASAALQQLLGVLVRVDHRIHVGTVELRALELGELVVQLLVLAVERAGDRPLAAGGCLSWSSAPCAHRPSSARTASPADPAPAAARAGPAESPPCSRSPPSR